MTRIVKQFVTCNNCKTSYSGLRVASTSGDLPKPDFIKAPLACPKCGSEPDANSISTTESLIGKEDALKGYDQFSNTFPLDTHNM